jgi:choline/glycine/proline betaine transport protein
MSSDAKGSLYERLTANMNPPVFFGAGAVVIGFCIFGAAFTDTAAPFFQWTKENISRYFGWYYVLIVAAALGFCVWLAASKVRAIRIGGPDARPEFTRISWFAMLFTAGMGIGLVFWAVAEPITHYANPLDAEPQTEAALREGMRLTFFHWGLHAWGIYAVLGLAVSYFHFNRGLPLAPRSILYPFIGERIHTPIGDVVDIISTVGTLLGVATSLGLGAQQINAGLTRVTGVPSNLTVQLLLVAGITLLATISVVRGVKGGIRVLSRFNGALAVFLVAYVLVMGPTLYQLETFTTTIGSYIQQLPRMTFYMELGAASGWQSDWTLFYWGWWISWAPFVAIFVARISKGRTIGEFVLTVLLVPTLVTFIWLSIFGGTALRLEAREVAELVNVSTSTPEVALHALLEHLPFTFLMQSLATLLIAVFFVTSSDSGSLVDDIVTSGGRLHPPRWQRVFWATSEGAAAMTLLVVGGLTAMRNASISMGIIMSVIIVASMASLATVLNRDPQVKRAPPRQRPAGS